MASKIKVNNIQDTGSNDIITSDGAGNVTVNTSLNFGDNDKAQFGAGSDLQIYHDGSNSYVAEGGSGTGNLIIKGNSVLIRNNSDENYIHGISNGEVRLYYDNAQKLATTSTGVDVTGTVTTDGLNVSGTSTLTGDVSVSGELNMTGTGTNILDYAGTAVSARWLNSSPVFESIFSATREGDISLYHNGSKKLETTSSGVSVTGDLSVSGNLLTRKFFAYGKNTNGTASGWRTIDFQTEVEDDDSRFTHTSGTYTVGESGTFLLVAGHHHTNGTHSEYQIRFHSNVHGFLAGMGTTNSDMISISMFHEATLNEVIKVQVYHSNTNHTDAGGRHSFFGGYLVK